MYLICGTTPISETMANTHTDSLQCPVLLYQLMAPHHPECHKNGINDMNLLDLIEMFCDWKAASERHNDGNIRKSIEINGKRFNMSDQLVKIFENSVEIL